jgi:hypothetical protein
MGYWAYYRELLRLVRRAPENPLIVRFAPWARMASPAGLLLALVVAELVSLVALLIASYVFPAKRVVALTLTDLAMSASIANSILGPCLIPVAILVYGTPLREHGVVRDVQLTRISAHEGAFASVFWGVVVGAVPSLVGGFAASLFDFGFLHGSNGGLEGSSPILHVPSRVWPGGRLGAPADSLRIAGRVQPRPASGGALVRLD